MQILNVKVMRGPNYWSNFRKRLIVMKLDISGLEEYPTNKIEGFYERLSNLLPSLYQHRCSEGKEGGFFNRVKDGTWAGHVVEHIALEIQSLAGMDCGFGRTRSAEKEGIYYVVFAYEIEKAGLHAGTAAVRIVEKLISGEPVNLDQDIQILRDIKNMNALGPSTSAIISEAVKRGIPYKRINNGSLVLFGQGVNQRKIRATASSMTSLIGVESACDKEETKKILSRAFIPIPLGEVAKNREELISVVERIGFPLVIKPIDGNHGNGVTTNIYSIEKALSALELAQTISEEVLVEKFLTGIDYRLLIINFKLIAAAKRTPALVKGDGISTIQQLIDQTNSDLNRGDDHEKVLSKIKIDKVTEGILAEKKLTLISILPKDEILVLKGTANISSGGTARDVTDIVHPYNVFLAERIARIMNLDICGIDVVTKDIAIPITENVGGIIEVNACPGLRMHLQPSKGLPRNVAAPIMKMLYPYENSSRIPVVAVTGTNGKTTTTRLIAHLAKNAGYKVGFTTTDGIYIQDHLVCQGDCTGAKSSQAVLQDPTVDFAVLECARGGILREGLGFDNCNVSIITNVSEDHLGLEGIDTLSDMARVKMVIARSTFPDGYAILNADDDLVYNMQYQLDCRIALFSTQAENERVKEHCLKGGLGAVIEKGYIAIYEAQWKTRICKIAEVPLSFSGKATSMIKNILPSVLAGFIMKFKPEDIKQALLSFIPSAHFTPGRMNMFHFKDFSILVDYAHNKGGFVELKQFLEQSDASHKIGIITGVGDRRDEDIINVGYIAAQIFDEIIIRHDEDLRGRTAEAIDVLLMQGIEKANTNALVKIISEEERAIEFAINRIKPGGLITVCSEYVLKTIELVNNIKQKEELVTI